MIGLLVAGDFADYASFPPFVESETDKRHLEEAYQGVSAEREARTKAHLTADELPMQIVVLNRPPGSKVNPHYHVNDPPAQSARVTQTSTSYSRNSLNLRTNFWSIG